MSHPSRQRFTDLPEAEQLKELTSSSLYTYTVIEPSGRILLVTSESLYGRSPSELHGSDLLSYIHPDEQESFRAAIQNAEQISLQHRMKHSSGAWRWVETTVRRSVRDTEAVICETHDITLNKLVTESLQDSLDWLTSIMDAFRDAVFIEENEKVTFINTAFVNLYGYASAGEIVGRDVADFQAPEDSQRMLNYSRTRAEGKYAPQVYQFYGKKKDGSYLLLEASVSSLQFGSRKIIVTVIHDLSDPTLL